MNYLLAGVQVKLRPTKITDAEKSARWLNDLGVKKFLGMTSPVTKESREKFLIKRLRSQNEKNFSIIEIDSGEYVGNVYLYNIDFNKKKAEVGIFIGEKNVWGKGYGTDAIEIIKKYAFDKLGLCKLYLSTYVENIAAIKCYQKAGFKEKEEKDNLLFFEFENER